MVYTICLDVYRVFSPTADSPQMCKYCSICMITRCIRYNTFILVNRPSSHLNAGIIPVYVILIKVYKLCTVIMYSLKYITLSAKRGPW